MSFADAENIEIVNISAELKTHSSEMVQMDQTDTDDLPHEKGDITAAVLREKDHVFSNHIEESDEFTWSIVNNKHSPTTDTINRCPSASIADDDVDDDDDDDIVTDVLRDTLDKVSSISIESPAPVLPTRLHETIIEDFQNNSDQLISATTDNVEESIIVATNDVVESIIKATNDVEESIIADTHDVVESISAVTNDGEESIIGDTHDVVESINADANDVEESIIADANDVEESIIADTNDVDEPIIANTGDVEELVTAATNDGEIIIEATNDDESTIEATNDDESTIEATNDDESTIEATNDDESTIEATNDADESTIEATNDDESTIEATNDSDETISLSANDVGESIATKNDADDSNATANDSDETISVSANDVEESNNTNTNDIEEIFEVEEMIVDSSSFRDVLPEKENTVVDSEISHPEVEMIVDSEISYPEEEMIIDSEISHPEQEIIVDLEVVEYEKEDIINETQTDKPQPDKSQNSSNHIEVPPKSNEGVKRQKDFYPAGPVIKKRKTDSKLIGDSTIDDEESDNELESTKTVNKDKIEGELPPQSIFLKNLLSDSKETGDNSNVNVESDNDSDKINKKVKKQVINENKENIRTSNKTENVLPIPPPPNIPLFENEKCKNYLGMDLTKCSKQEMKDVSDLVYYVVAEYVVSRLATTNDVRDCAQLRAELSSTKSKMSLLRRKTDVVIKTLEKMSMSKKSDASTEMGKSSDSTKFTRTVGLNVHLCCNKKALANVEQQANQTQSQQAKTNISHKIPIRPNVGSIATKTVRNIPLPQSNIRKVPLAPKVNGLTPQPAQQKPPVSPTKNMNIAYKSTASNRLQTSSSNFKNTTSPQTAIRSKINGVQVAQRPIRPQPPVQAVQKTSAPCPQPTPSTKSTTVSVATKTTTQVSNLHKSGTSVTVVPSPSKSPTLPATSKPQSAVVIDLTDKEEEEERARRKKTKLPNGDIVIGNMPALPPLPKTPSYLPTVLRPPRPVLKITKSPSAGIMLSWNFDSAPIPTVIIKYHVFAYQVGGTDCQAAWKKVGEVDALPLPMACTLTQFKAGFVYYFAVRAMDCNSRIGEFSLPGSITLTKTP